MGKYFLDFHTSDWLKQNKTQDDAGEPKQAIKLNCHIVQNVKFAFDYYVMSIQEHLRINLIFVNEIINPVFLE